MPNPRPPLTTLHAASTRLGVALLGLSPAVWSQLYAVESETSAVYTIDLTTGAATLDTPGGTLDLGGIAFNPYGTLFGVTRSSNETRLFTLGIDGGITSPVSLTTVSGIEGGLCFDPVTGDLYGRGGALGEDPDLVTIDPVTGSGTVVGTMGLGIGADVCGMDFLDDGTLLGHDLDGTLPNRLVSIDKTTGLATVIGFTGDTSTSTDVGGLAVDPDTDQVYLSNGTELWSVDPASGAAALIGAHGTSLPVSGLSFRRPTPCLIGVSLSSPYSTLWDVDPFDGTSTNPRITGITGFGGLARAPTGELYALQSTATGSIYEIDIETGLSTLVGDTGLQVPEGGLDFDPVSGVLYGVNGRVSSSDPPGLFTVDVSSGVGTMVGPILTTGGVLIDASAMAFDSDGNLFVLRTWVDPVEIWQVDPADASVISMTPVPGLSYSVLVGGMEFDEATDILHVSLRTSEPGIFAEVDPYTGASTVLGSTFGVSGLEFICPAPSGGTPPSITVAPGLATPVLQDWARPRR